MYRIGGDEFVAFLDGEDYANRKQLVEEFNRTVEKNQVEGAVVIACGFAEFIPKQDKNYLKMFERADKQMYEKKCNLKKR